MQQRFDPKARKNILAASVMALSVLTVVGVTLKSRSSLAAGDKNSLKLQRAAMGMPDPEQMRARMLEDLARDLGLTEARKAQLKTAMESGPDPRAIFADNSLSREQKFARLRTAGLDREAHIRAILTPEQQTRYEQRQAQMRERFQQRRGAGRERDGFGPSGFGQGVPGGIGPLPGRGPGDMPAGGPPMMPPGGFPAPPNEGR